MTTIGSKLTLPEEELREWINSVYAKPLRNYIKSLGDEDTIRVGDGPAYKAGYLKGLINRGKQGRRKDA